MADGQPGGTGDWTGFYVGGNLGGAWTSDDIKWVANPAGFGAGPFTAALNAGGTGHLDPAGVTVGGQLGYNHQLGNSIVLGIEADFSYTDLTEGRIAAVAPPAVAGTVATSTFESKWLATIRARMGIQATPTVLLYGTGGVAFAEVQTSDFAVFPFDGSINASSSDRTRTGWTVGGGAEWAWMPNWSVKAEYLFLDFGSVSETSTNTVVPIATIRHDHDITASVARIGLNYRFSGGDGFRH